MIRPTRKAVLLFGALLPVPWLVLVFQRSLYFLTFDVSAVILLIIATDAVLAYPRNRISLTFRVAESAFIGDAIEAVLRIVTGKRRRPAQFEVAVELEGDAQPELARNPFVGGKTDGPETIRITTRRRGAARVCAIWVRWEGPLGLVEQACRFPVDRTVRVLSHAGPLAHPQARSPRCRVDR